MADHAKITEDLIKATMAVVERDVGLGIISVERTRYAMVDRKKIAQELSAKGLSARQIAKVTGASKSAIARDLGVPNGTETVQNGTPPKRNGQRHDDLELQEPDHDDDGHHYREAHGQPKPDEDANDFGRPLDASAHQFHRELLQFKADYSNRFRNWLAGATIDSHTRNVLSGAIHGCANELTMLAQEVMGE